MNLAPLHLPRMLFVAPSSVPEAEGDSVFLAGASVFTEEQTTVHSLSSPSFASTQTCSVRSLKVVSSP